MEKSAVPIWEFPGLLTLLVLRLRIVWNVLWHAVRAKPKRATLYSFLGLGFLLLSYLSIANILGVSTGHKAAYNQLENTLAGGLVLVAGFTAVTSVTFALASLYFAKDLEFLLATPVPARSIVLSRILGQMGLGVMLGMVVVGPPALAWLIGQGAGLVALPILVVAVAATSIPLGLATGFVVLTVRLLPARYVRNATGLVITATIFLVTAVNLFLRGGKAFAGTLSNGLPLQEYGGGLAGAGFTPMGAGARSIASLIKGNWGLAVEEGIPLIVVAVALLALLAWGLEKVYLTGYQRNSVAARGRGRSRRGLRERGPQWAWFTIAAKDLRMIRRDAAQLGQLLLPLVLFALYLGSPTMTIQQVGRLPSWVVIAITAAGASLFAASGLALRGVGMEGSRLWILRESPARPVHILLAKFAVGVVVAFLLALVLLLVGEIRVGVGGLDMITSAGRLLIMVTGVVGMATGLGAIWPRLDWMDSRRAIGIGTTIGFLIAGLTYVMGAFTILVLPYVGPGGLVAPFVSDLGITLLALVVGGSFMGVGAWRVAKIEV